MIKINGTEYKLCLLDTNILSEMVKTPNRELRNFLAWSLPNKIIPCVSLFTILELRRSAKIYKEFLKLFEALPFFIAKSHEQLFKEERSSYPYPESVSPVLVAYEGVLASDEKKLSKFLDTVFSNPQVANDEDYWNQSRESILAGILDLIKNYPPSGSKYSPQEIKTFIEIAGFTQVAYRDMSFVSSKVNKGDSLKIDAFPSIKLTLYVVFYKFYSDNRRPQLSDSFDIIIFSSVPYMDYVISERHLADMILKIKKHDSFLDDVQIVASKDFR